MVCIKPMFYCLIVLTHGLGYFVSTYGLAIDKCDHDKLSNAVSKLISCSGKIVDKYLEEFLKEYDAQLKANSNTFDLAKVEGIIQKINDDELTCAIEFSDACFETAITDLVKLFFKASNEIMSTEVTIDGLDENYWYTIETGTTTNDLSKLQYVKELIKKFNDTTSGKPEEYFLEIFKSDKKCKMAKVEESLDNDYVANCVTNQTKLLEPIYEYVREPVFESDSDLKLPFPKWISLCQRMDDMMRTCL